MKRDDLLGFLAAMPWTTLPLLILTGFREGISKDPPEPTDYVTPAVVVVGLGAGLGCLLLARLRPREEASRIAVSGGLGILFALVLVLSFCVWCVWVISSHR